MHEKLYDSRPKICGPLGQHMGIFPAMNLTRGVMIIEGTFFGYDSGAVANYTYPILSPRVGVSKITIESRFNAALLECAGKRTILPKTLPETTVSSC